MDDKKHYKEIIMYKKILGTTALVFSLAISPAVFAHDSCGGGMKKMLESLKLDATQKEKIKPIMDNMKSTMKADVAQMKDLNKQLNEQTLSATMDQSTVDGLLDKKVKLMGDMMKAKVMAKNQIYVVLKPEQKTKLQDDMKKMEAKMEAKFKSCEQE